MSMYEGLERFGTD